MELLINSHGFKVDKRNGSSLSSWGGGLIIKSATFSTSCISRFHTYIHLVKSRSVPSLDWNAARHPLAPLCYFCSRWYYISYIVSSMGCTQCGDT